MVLKHNKETNKTEGMKIFEKAIENASPVVEVKLEGLVAQLIKYQ